MIVFKQQYFIPELDWNGLIPGFFLAEKQLKGFLRRKRPIPKKYGQINISF